MDLNWVAVVLLTLPTAIAMVWLLVRNGPPGWYASVFLALLALAPAGAYFAWQSAKWYGIAYAFITYGSAALYLLAVENAIRVANPVMYSGFGVLLLSVATVVPVSIMPAVRSRPTFLATSSAPRPADASFLKSSSQQLETSLQGVIADIEREQSRIDRATASLVDEVQRQNNRLRQVQLERDDLIVQVRQLRALASLNEDQVKAIRAHLERGKYIDYGIGFVLGIISSIVAPIITGGKLRGH